MQVKIDFAELWKNTVDYYKHAEVFTVQWTSCNFDEVIAKGVFANSNLSKFEMLYNMTHPLATNKKQYCNAYD